MCKKGGYIWIYPKKDQVALTGADNLSGYAFGHKAWKKLFCKVCGVQIMTEVNVHTAEELAALPEDVRKFVEDKGDYRPINARIFNHFDPLSLKTYRSDGWTRMGPPYVNP